MTPDDGPVAARRPGLFDVLRWIGAGLACAAVLAILWTLAAPKAFYDARWSHPKFESRVSPGEIARYDAALYHVRSLETVIEGDRILVHPDIVGELEGSYKFRSDLTLGSGGFAVATNFGWVELPERTGMLDIGFALNELDSAFAAQRKIRPEALSYQVRFLLEPQVLVDPQAQQLLVEGKLGQGHPNSSAFVARSYQGR